MDEQDQGVGDQGQCQHQHQAHDDRRVEGAPEAKVEELAKRSATDENCNADQGDVRDGDDAETGEITGMASGGSTRSSRRNQP